MKKLLYKIQLYIPVATVVGVVKTWFVPIKSPLDEFLFLYIVKGQRVYDVWSLQLRTFAENLFIKLHWVLIYLNPFSILKKYSKSSRARARLIIPEGLSFGKIDKKNRRLKHGLEGINTKTKPHSRSPPFEI